MNLSKNQKIAVGLSAFAIIFFLGFRSGEVNTLVSRDANTAQIRNLLNALKSSPKQQTIQPAPEQPIFPSPLSNAPSPITSSPGFVIPQSILSSVDNFCQNIDEFKAINNINSVLDMNVVSPGDDPQEARGMCEKWQGTYRQYREGVYDGRTVWLEVGLCGDGTRASCERACKRDL